MVADTGGVETVGEAPERVFSSPGTTSPAAGIRTTSLRRFVLPLIASATFSFGTVAAITPADAATALHARSALNSTRGGFFLEESAGPAQEVGAALQRLRTVSGLTWGEVAKALGVSRRAVHHWVAGARISARHAARLRALTQLVALNDAGEPDRTRARVIAPDSQGRSVLDLFSQQFHSPRSIPLSTQSLSDILEASREDLAAPPQPQMTRASALRGRRLGRSADRSD